MDPGTILDCAVFQLTPTRTRCELVIFHGGKAEKLASGLFDPFVTHLKYAKDEISKGGYSIALRPPPSDEDDSWFTKYTLERFVRFVSTPEVLERFIRLEKEIVQIENQLRENGLAKAIVVRQASPSDALVPKTDSPNPSTKPEGNAVEEENSRMHLQHLLESRKMLLRKAQAMAYARGRAAGFEMDNIDELISFAEAFGALRLRDACVEFKTLCEKKQTDVPWMEEVSAMEAFSSSEQPFPITSGIFLTNDANGSSNGSSDMLQQETASQILNTEGKKENNVLPQPVPYPQIPMQFPWASHFPQVMYPPYPGFPFPPMKLDISANAAKASRKKEKPQSYKGDTESSNETGSEVSNSDGEKGSGSSAERKKKHSRRKHKKKSSRTVVIRNINYITSQKDGEATGGSSGSSTVEGELIDGDSLTTKVMDVVESLKSQKPRRHSDSVAPWSFVESAGYDVSTGERTNKNWDAFQNLLMRDEEPKLEHGLDISESRDTKIKASAATKLKISDDSLAVTDMHGADESKENSLGFDGEENVCLCLKKADCADNMLLISAKLEGLGTMDADRGYAAENSSIKLRKSEGDFVVDKSEATFNGDYMLLPIEETFERSSKQKDVPVDDSFMIQDRTHVYDEYDSSSRDVSLTNEFVSPPKAERDNLGASEDKHKVSRSLQPDDLCMVLMKDMKAESVNLSWTSDYTIDASFVESERRTSNEPRNSVDDPASKIEENGKNEAAEGTDSHKGVKTRVPQRPVGNTRSEIASKARRPSLVGRSTLQKSKLEKEEEMRKKMEEMAIQRQKRIAERTAAASGVTPLATKRSPAESKTVRASLTGDKTKSLSTARPTNRLSTDRAVRI